MLLIIPDQYPKYYKALEIYTGYFNSLDIMYGNNEGLLYLLYPIWILIILMVVMWVSCSSVFVWKLE